MPQLHTALGFWRSKEGEKEYEKLGLNYSNHETVHDAIYRTDFLVNYRKSKDPADSTWFSNVVRVQSSFDPNPKNDKKDKPHKREYLTHDIYETRLDQAKNRKRFYRSNIGIYPIPQVSWKLVRNPETGLVNYDENGNPERVIDRITNLQKGYSIPFSKTTLQKWVSDGSILNEEGRQTHFSIRKEGERESIIVKSLDDLINESFDKLYEDGWTAYHNFMRHNVPVTSTTEVQQQQAQAQT